MNFTRYRAAMLTAILSTFASRASAQTFQQPMPALVAPNDPWIQPNGDWDQSHIAFHFPISLGMSVPFGSLDGSGSSYSNNTGPFTNFELGAGLRVGRLVGDLVFAFGGAGLRNASEQSIRAAGYDPGGAYRVFFGIDGAYYLARTPSWAPWVGGRFGYEAMGFSGASGREHLSSSMGGLYLAARSGVDWRITNGFGIGAFLELGVGRFMTGSVTTYREDDPTTSFSERAASEESRDINLRGGAFHGYFGFGLRIAIFP